MSEQRAAQDLLDEIAGLAEDGDKAHLRDLIKALGHRGFGPLLFLFALIEMSPLGGVPGVPSVIALILTLIAVQILIGRRHFWLPGMIGKRKLPQHTLQAGAQKLRPLARWTDRILGGHLVWLTGETGQKLAALAVIVLCATVPFLELVPFASTAPMLAIALLGLAITAHDGIVMLGALVIAVSALIFAVTLLI